MISTKSKILTLLEGNRDCALSGSAIAKALNLSRSAVWKGVEELRRDGYEIEAVTNKGYSLTKNSDILSAEGLLIYLRNPLITHDKIHVYKSIGSTNQEAKKMAVAGAGQGTLVIADEQTEGRGRLGRSFFSPQGTGIYMSLILRPRDSDFEAVSATTAAASAVCRALSETLNIEAGIKWVNDIFVGDLKVCGILAEAVSDFQTHSIESLIIGIGINVMTAPDSFPDEVRGIAGSLLNAKTTVSRNQLAAAVLDELLDLVFSTDAETMIEEYRSRSFLPGKPITVYRGNETYAAKALDIDNKGGLIVEKCDGSIETLRSGEVSVRPVTARTLARAL